MSDLSFSLALERLEDDEAIDRLNARIFGPGRFARTAARLREGAGRAEALCFTARVGTLLATSTSRAPALTCRSFRRPWSS